MTAIDLLVLLVTGAAAGVLGGLFGIGGGIILVPALYAILTSHGVAGPPAIKMAIGTSLASIIVTSVRSAWRHHRHGNVDLAVLRLWAPFVALGAALGAATARFADGVVLSLIFGFGLMALGIHRALTTTRNPPGDAAIRLPPKPAMAGIGLGIGALSSLMGIGGGVLGVVVLSRAGFGIHRAVGTSAGLGILIALPGAVGYALGGYGDAGILAATDFRPIGYIALWPLLAIATCTFFLAPVGASLAQRISPRTLSRAFAAYAVITGALMVREAF